MNKLNDGVIYRPETTEPKNMAHMSQIIAFHYFFFFNLLSKPVLALVVFTVLNVSYVSNADMHNLIILLIERNRTNFSFYMLSGIT